MARFVRMVLLCFALHASAGGSSLVSEVRVLFPVGGSTIWLNESVGEIALPLLVETDLPQDTDAVEVFLAQQGEALPGALVGIDVQAPYRLEMTLGAGLRFDQILTLTTRATSIGNPQTQPASLIQFAYGFAEGDDDENGLPDVPDDVLSEPGDAWFSTANFDGESIPKMLSVASMLVSPADTDLFVEVPLVLPSLTLPEQVVRATATGEMLDSGESGLFIVQSADALADLVGEEEAGNFADLPLDGLVENTPVVAVIGARRTGPNAFGLLRSEQLQRNPISVVVEGLALNLSRAYSVYQHPLALLDDDSESLGIAVPRGASWTPIADAEVNASAGRVSVEVTAPGVLSVVEIESAGEGEGEGDLLLRILTALGIMGLVDGGVGGGSPCFIATAAYGTPLAGEIDILRAFRDQALLSNTPGTALVDAYYRLSPAVADRIAESPTLAMLCRLSIAGVLLVVGVGNAMGGAGILITVLGVCLLHACCSVAVNAHTRRRPGSAP